MQLKTIKNASEAGIPGLQFVKTDTTITEVIIGKVRIRPGTYQGISVVIEQPFEEVERWRMTAKIDGFDPKVTFHETEWDAQKEGDEFRLKGAAFEVSKVEALLNEAGEIVGIVGEHPLANDDGGDLSF